MGAYFEVGDNSRLGAYLNKYGNWICLTTFWVLLILPQALNDDKVPLNKAHIVTIATLTGHAIIAMGPAYSVCHKTFCLHR